LPFVLGCDEAYRIPRIEPVLHAWPDPYRGVDGLRVHVFDTGTMSIPAALVHRGGNPFEPHELDVAAFVVEHPVAGLIVFDTGFGVRVRTDPEAYLGVVLNALAGFEMGEGQELAAQMRDAGLDPASVEYVVLSHLHFDHSGSVEAFGGATTVVAHAERDAARASSGLLDFYFTEDVDEVGEWLEVDYDGGEPLATFTAHHDLLGDGSVVLVDLAGHTAGSQGMLLSTSAGPVLLAGGVAAIEENWRYASRPALAHDPKLWWEQVWRIKKLVQLVPDAIVLPGHDIEAIERIDSDVIDVHAWTEGGDGGGGG